MQVLLRLQWLLYCWFAIIMTRIWWVDEMLYIVCSHKHLYLSVELIYHCLHQDLQRINQRNKILDNIYNWPSYEGHNCEIPKTCIWECVREDGSQTFIGRTLCTFKYFCFLPWLFAFFAKQVQNIPTMSNRGQSHTWHDLSRTINKWLILDTVTVAWLIGVGGDPLGATSILNRRKKKIL